MKFTNNKKQEDMKKIEQTEQAEGKSSEGFFFTEKEHVFK